MKKLRSLVMFLVVGCLQSAEATKAKSPVGMWNDGRIAENTGLYFASDGSGDLISDVCCALCWSYDSVAKTVRVQLQVPGQKEKGQELLFRYDDERETLTSEPKRGERDWKFERTDQRSIDWWLAVKKRNEARKKANKAPEPTPTSVTPPANVPKSK